MSDNLKAKNNSWQTDLSILTTNLRVALPANDPNKYNYRLDTLGAESEYQGFATVIIYMQLSEKVSLSEQVLKETEGFRKRFITACIEKGETIKLAGFDALL